MSDTENKAERMAREGEADAAPKNIGPETPETLRAAEKFTPTEVPKRRAAMLMVKPGEFMFLFTKGLRFQKNFKVIEGVPEDAKVIAVAPDSIRNGIMIVITSSEFDEIPINVLPPVLPVNIDLDGIKNATKKKNVPARKKGKK
jgi:hypothetical protein